MVAYDIPPKLNYKDTITEIWIDKVRNALLSLVSNKAEATPPFCAAYIQDGQSIPDSSNTKLIFNGPSYDPTGSMFDVAQSRIYIPENGLYLIDFAGTWSGIWNPDAGGHRRIRILTVSESGVHISRLWSELPAIGGGAMTHQAHVTASLRAGSYVEIWATQTSGVNLVLRAGVLDASGFLTVRKISDVQL